MIYYLDHVNDYDEGYLSDISELLPDNLKAVGIL